MVMPYMMSMMPSGRKKEAVDEATIKMAFRGKHSPLELDRGEGGSKTANER